MKIGIDARMYGSKVSGIGNYVRHLIENLVKNDSTNEYCLFLNPKNFDELTFNNPRVKKIRTPEPWYSLKEQLTLWRRIEKEKPDITHFPNFNVPLFFTRKFVLTIHDMTAWKFPGHRRRESHLRRLGFMTAFDSAMKRAKKIITVSEHSKNEILSRYSKFRDKIRVITLGIEESFRREENYGIINEIRKKYSIQKPYIFYIGVWRAHKNIPGLLRAFHLMREKYRFEACLVLAGDNTFPDPKISQTIKDLHIGSEVVIAGYVPDSELRQLYSGALVTVIPSFNEGFGLHALESLACETPVAASKTTSVPEILGDAALYFDPKNPEEMAEILWRVAKNGALRKRLVERGKTVLGKYSWEESARKTLSVYTEAANG